MIAYNHYIDFIPKLTEERAVAGSFAHILTVKESPPFDLSEKLEYKIEFFRNQGRTLSLYFEREYSRTQEGRLWALVVEDVVSFFWESGTKTLCYMAGEGLSERLLEYWTLHIALPLFFTIEESYDFLHAGAVEVDGKPILFTAESFGGKSTVTGFFLRRGHRMISDDKVAFYEEGGQLFAIPSHPHHRPHRKMEDLGHFIENIALNPKPIYAIYELEKVKPNASIEITELHGIEKFKSLRYSSDINLSFLKVKRFVFLSHLAKAVPLYRVTLPWDIERLDEVYDVICEHKFSF
ncbi:MAG: hypothetical protein U9R27_04290 [Campylobacterota bacterium]|nr:hypothetical protein [Campylobacterota bacterium]